MKIFRFSLICLLSSAGIAIAVQNKTVASYASCDIPGKTLSQAQNSEEKAQVYYDGAYNCYRSGIGTKQRFYYKQAIAYYTKAISLNPGLVKTYLSYSNRGLTYEALEEYEKALADYNQAIRLNPNLPIAYINRGGVYEELEKYEKALEDYTQAIHLNPDSVSAYLARGGVHERLKQEQKALNDYTKAIHFKPDSIDAYLARGNTYQKLEEYQKALNDYTKAIALIPDLKEAYFNRNDIIPEATSLGRKLAKAYRKRGDVYRELKEYQKAINDFSESNFVQPLLLEFYLSRGDVYRGIADYQKALNDYTKVIRRNNPIDSARAYLGMGYLYLNRNNKSQAVKSFQKAANLFQQQGNINLYQTTIDEIERLP